MNSPLLFAKLSEPRMCHPAEQGWSPLVEMDPDVRLDIDRRFDHSIAKERNVGRLVAAILTHTTSLNAIRAAEESANRALLASKVLYEETIDINSELENVSSDAEYVAWFDDAARRAFKWPHEKAFANFLNRESLGVKTDKIATELFGVVQAGNWVHTTDLDNRIRSLKESLLQLYPKSHVEELEGEDMIVNYSAKRINLGAGPEAYIVHRRRAVADIYFPKRDYKNQGQVIPNKLFKLSDFLVTASPEINNNPDLINSHLNKSGKIIPMDELGQIVNRALGESQGITRNVFPLISRYVVFQERLGR